MSITNSKNVQFARTNLNFLSRCQFSQILANPFIIYTSGSKHFFSTLFANSVIITIWLKHILCSERIILFYIHVFLCPTNRSKFILWPIFWVSMIYVILIYLVLYIFIDFSTSRVFFILFPSSSLIFYPFVFYFYEECKKNL